MNLDENAHGNEVQAETPGFPRRSFLKLAAAGLAPIGLAHGLSAVVGETTLAGQAGAHLIARQKEPENLESPFSALDGTITPNELFYVRTHFATPHLVAKEWRLQVEGAVQHPFTLTYDELKSLPSRKITATLECAGNGRVYLTPPARGVQWEQGAVSTAEWTGVSLSTLLQKAGVNPEAVEVVLEGSDSGEIKDPPHPGTALSFSRSLPLSKAIHGDVLIAYEMNGKSLPVAHGFPARAIVPGWFAVASVKWIKRLLVVSHPYSGYFQTIDYAYWKHQDGLVQRVPLTDLLVKSQIARPSFRETIQTNAQVTVAGAAWAGESGIAKVEFSSDGGMNWNPARLVGEGSQFAWRLWEYDWKTPNSPGRVSLMSRATDGAGNVQPATRDLDRENYMINQIVPIEVEVR